MGISLGESPDPTDIDRFLAEDVGTGDLTAETLPQHLSASATVITREPMVLCGRAWFDGVFSRLGSGVVTEWLHQEGDWIEANEMLCRLEGPARLLMTGERTALNLLQTLSGTATLSKRYAEAVEGTTLKILDTRKTLPGLRNAQKYAVKIGGCHNHRIGLYDGILIKENHIRAIGSITLAVEAARNLGRQVMIEVEVESLEELDEALSAGVQRILIDEFTPAMREAAVRRSRGRAELEVSGNVRIEDLPEIARSGVDYVSIGSLTKHLRAVDLSMQVEIGAGS
jgi:nicotinate-nucleotide pyrophosphorylase (carboxylating)